MLGLMCRGIWHSPDYHSGTQPTGIGCLLGLFMRTLGLWVFPHSNRYPQATAAGIGRKGGSWVRIQGQVRQGVRNPGRWRWEVICKIGSVLSKCFADLGIAVIH